MEINKKSNKIVEVIFENDEDEFFLQPLTYGKELIEYLLKNKTIVHVIFNFQNVNRPSSSFHLFFSFFKTRMKQMYHRAIITKYTNYNNYIKILLQQIGQI